MDLTQLIALGYTAEEILQTMYKKSPSKLKNVNKLMAYGYLPATILKGIVGDKKNPDDAYMTDEQRTFQADEQRRGRFGNMLGGAALGLGALATGLAAPRAAIAAAGIGSGEQQSETQESAVSPQQMQATKALSAAKKANQSTGISRQEIIEQAESMAPSINENIEVESRFLKQFPALTQMTERLVKDGKSIDEAYSILNKSKLTSSMVRNYESKTGRSFKDYIKSFKDSSKSPNNRIKVLDNTAILLEKIKQMKGG